MAPPTRTLAPRGERLRAGVRTARVPLFSAVLAALAAVLLVVAVPHHVHLTGPRLLACAALALAFAVTETIVLNVEIGGSAHTATLAELPLVLALLSLDPLLVVAVRLLGAVVGLAVGRRQSAEKLTFNLAQMAVEAVLAVLVVGALLAPSSPVLERWCVVLLACALANTFTCVAVFTVISLHAGRAERAGFVRGVRDTLVTGSVTATLGLLAAQAVSGDPTAAGPLLLLGAALAMTYRGHARLRRRHDRLTSLHGFVRAVSSAPRADGTVAAVLEHTLALLRGEVAVLTLLDEDTDGSAAGLPLIVHRLQAGGELCSERHVAGSADWPVARCLASGQHLLAARGSRDPAVVAHLRSLGVRDAVLVAVPGADAPRGTLLVGSRIGEHATFEAEDVVALEGVAGHASVALHNSSLVDRLLHESRHDLLTGLPNRTAFLDRLATALAAQEHTTGVLLMDLDRFKDVNDTLGHAAGDQLLQRVAARLAGAMTGGAAVARLGGDEFAVVLPEHSAAAALQVAQRLRTAVGQPVEVDGLFVDVGVSIGVAVSPEHGQDASALLRRADIAMYDAKTAEGLALYDPQRDDSSASRLALVAQLRTALAVGQFTLDFQPQVDGADVPRRFEALVRWRHPQRGLVPPDDFVPVAERAGLLQDLTTWVLRTSLDAAVRWRDAGHDLGVAVNLSPRNLLDPGLPALVRRELALRGLPADRLTLEITEGTIMAEPARAVQTLQQLRATGVRLSIDDFGTGYSSLSYLKELPVDEVKIDKTFVRELATDEAEVAIVRAVLALAASLGLEVVAEGVEDETSRQRLVAMGCGLLQGYHLSRPMPAGDVLGWLQAHDSRGGAAVLPLPLRRGLS